MSRIRGKNTKPELLIRKHLYSHGVRYRLHTSLPGKPDIVIGRKKLIIFVNGCFWHAHSNCKDFRWPKTRTDFWKEKIGGNVLRDHKNYAALNNDGWKVLVVWECEIKRNKDRTLSRVLSESLIESDVS